MSEWAWLIFFAAGCLPLGLIGFWVLWDHLHGRDDATYDGCLIGFMVATTLMTDHNHLRELPPHTRLILASEDLLERFGTRTEDGYRITAEWGEQKPEGWYEPTFTVHHDDRLALDENDRLREALLGIIGIHHGMGFRDGGYGHYDNACATCGTSDEYAVEWPCSTVLAARAALESSRPSEARDAAT